MHSYITKPPLLINTVSHPNIFQPLKGHVKGVYLIHFSGKFNTSHQMSNSESQIKHIYKYG